MFDENLIFSFSLAFLVTFASVPLIRVVAFKIKAVDIPKDNRRMHKRPIPYLGGIAIFLGFIVSVACFAEVIDRQLLGILLGSSIIIVVGVLDDRFSLRPLVKLSGQIAAAAVVIIAGVRIDLLTNPLIIGDSIIELSYLSIPITLIWILIMTNAVNLIDGLDGLATSISGVSAMALVILCMLTLKFDMAVILVAVSGACFGFLPYNQYPAKIFMGDTGAMFLGFILSALSIQGFFKNVAVITFIVPIIVLALPIFDTSFAIIRRIIKKKGIMQGDRGHLHHRMIDSGFSQREAVTSLTTFSALFSISAIILITKGINRAVVLLVVLVMLIIGTWLYAKHKDTAKKFFQEFRENGSDSDESN